jgi:hypothetical protein
VVENTEADVPKAEAEADTKEESKVKVDEEVNRWEVEWPDAKYLRLSFDAISSIREAEGYVTIRPLACADSALKTTTSAGK